MKTLIETTLICTNWVIIFNVAKEINLLINGG
jgi:hypothetical protein